MCSRPSAHPLRRQCLWEAAASPSGLQPGWHPIPQGQAPTPEVSLGLKAGRERGSRKPAPVCPPGQGPLAHRLQWPPTEPGRRRRHCSPHWTGLPQARGRASWPPAPAPRGCAGPGCGGAGPRTAGPCPWSWPGEAEEVPVIGLVGRRPPGWCGCCPALMECHDHWRGLERSPTLSPHQPGDHRPKLP